MLRIRRALAITALLATCPAYAATVTGIAAPDSDGLISVSGPAPTGPGVYKLAFAVDRPGSGTFTLFGQLNGEFFDPVTGDYMGGNDTPFEPNWSYPTPVSGASLLFKVPRPTAAPFAGFIYREFYSFDRTQLDLLFPGAGLVGYSITAQFLTAIPEPATWAMLIAGLFTIGIQIRRKHYGQFTPLKVN